MFFVCYRGIVIFLRGGMIIVVICVIFFIFFYYLRIGNRERGNFVLKIILILIVVSVIWLCIFNVIDGFIDK